MVRHEKEIVSEAEPDRLYQMCAKLEEAAKALSFVETPAMLQVGLSTEREVAEKGAKELLIQWREQAAAKIEVFFPHGTLYDVRGLKQSYFAVEMLYIALLVRWRMLAEAEKSIDDLLAVVISEPDVAGLRELLDEVWEELQHVKEIEA